MKIFPAIILVTGLLVGGCATAVKNSSPQAPVVDASPAADVLIISAAYGSGTRVTDVTDRVNSLLRQPNVVLHAHPYWLGGDPASGSNKTLVVIYEYEGQRCIYVVGDDGEISMADLVKSGKNHHGVKLGGAW
jgi:hypothetical protein